VIIIKLEKEYKFGEKVYKKIFRKWLCLRIVIQLL
jgi:hypothetical protein